jgi:hypothetical protein
VEPFLGQEVVEVVSGDPPGQVLGISSADLVGVTVAKVLEPAVDLALAAPSRMIRSSSSSLVAPTVIRVPSWRRISSSWTWSEVRPVPRPISEWTPQELLPIMPPSVLWVCVEGSGAKVSL